MAPGVRNPDFWWLADESPISSAARLGFGQLVTDLLERIRATNLPAEDWDECLKNACELLMLARLTEQALACLEAARPDNWVWERKAQIAAETADWQSLLRLLEQAETDSQPENRPEIVASIIFAWLSCPRLNEEQLQLLLNRVSPLSTRSDSVRILCQAARYHAKAAQITEVERYLSRALDMISQLMAQDPLASEPGFLLADDVLPVILPLLLMPQHQELKQRWLELLGRLDEDYLYETFTNLYRPLKSQELVIAADELLAELTRLAAKLEDYRDDAMFQLGRILCLGNEAQFQKGLDLLENLSGRQWNSNRVLAEVLVPELWSAARPDRAWFCFRRLFESLAASPPKLDRNLEHLVRLISFFPQAQQEQASLREAIAWQPVERAAANWSDWGWRCAWTGQHEQAQVYMDKAFELFQAAYQEGRVELRHETQSSVEMLCLAYFETSQDSKAEWLLSRLDSDTVRLRLAAGRLAKALLEQQNVERFLALFEDILARILNQPQRPHWLPIQIGQLLAYPAIAAGLSNCKDCLFEVISDHQLDLDPNFLCALLESMRESLYRIEALFRKPDPGIGTG